jgi:hypothetical protein
MWFGKLYIGTFVAKNKVQWDHLQLQNAFRIIMLCFKKIWFYNVNFIISIFHFGVKYFVKENMKNYRDSTFHLINMLSPMS